MFRIFLFSILSFFVSQANSQTLKVSVSFISKTTSLNNDTIYYSPIRKLTWADFQGKPLQSTLEAAITASGYAYNARIEYLDNKPTLSVEVYCFFTKHNSWRRSEIDDTYHLEHEQHHFDITFLGAMKFINAIQQTHFAYKNFGHTLNNLFKKSISDNNQWQDQYDTETSHSLNIVQQDAWNNKIDSLVNKVSSSFPSD